MNFYEICAKFSQIDAEVPKKQKFQEYNSDNFVVRSSNNTSYINATELPPIGKWTHVAAVRDGSTLYLFYKVLF